MSDSTSFSRRALLASAPVVLGATLSKTSQAAKIGSSSRPALATILVTASLSNIGVQSVGLHKGARRLQDSIESIRADLGGQLSHFFFLGGNWRLWFVVELPRAAVRQLLTKLSAEKVLLSETINLARVNGDIRSIDSELRIGASAADPWLSK